MKILLRYYALCCLVLMVLMVMVARRNHRAQNATDAPTANLLHHAALLDIEESDSFTLARIKSPWDSTDLLATLVLVPKGSPVPQNVPPGTVVRTPLRHTIVTTSVHTALLWELGAGASISGVTDGQYIVSPGVKDYLRRHHVSDLGSSMQPDWERMRAVGADAVLISPYDGNRWRMWEKAGGTVIPCADYMETSPLGRAEWMRLFGRLFGQTHRADSLFAAVESRYEEIKTEAAERSEALRPTVFFDLMAGSVWYQPGGGSTIGQMVADAGGRYLWSDRGESGSLNLGLEAVYARAHDADVWLVRYASPTPLSYEGMAREQKAYGRFAAWQKKHVYACHTLQTPYYEDTPFHPECLLAEMALIFRQPNNPDSRSLRYFRKL